MLSPEEHRQQLRAKEEGERADAVLELAAKIYTGLAIDYIQKPSPGGITADLLASRQRELAEESIVAAAMFTHAAEQYKARRVQRARSER